MTAPELRRTRRASTSPATTSRNQSSAFFDFDITLQLNETSIAALRITQTSEANLGAVNNGNSTSTFANPPNTILYGQPACTLP